VRQDTAPREPNATLQDLKRLLWAVFLIELCVAGLALLARPFFGARPALFVGLGIGGLVLAAFVLVVAFSFGASAVEEWLAGRNR
jgi:hypothetical protein